MARSVCEACPGLDTVLANSCTDGLTLPSQDVSVNRLGRAV
jgi:hypothetical protein